MPLAFIIWTIIVISRLKFNGSIYGLDYSIYQPDGANYTYRTLSFIEDSPFKAAIRVSSWYQVHGYKHNIIDPNTLLPGLSPVWHLSAPRIVYPVLSIPFVLIFGIPGMLVIPALSLLGIFIVNQKIAEFYGRPAVGLICNLILGSSLTVSRWFIANLTDSLLAFLAGLFVLIELKIAKRKTWILVVVCIVLTSSATRFCFPLYFALGCGFLIQRVWFKSITLIVSSISGAIPLLFFMAPNNGISTMPTMSTLSRIIEFIIQSVKVLTVESAELLVLDRQLFVLVLLALYSCLLLRDKESILIFAIFIGVIVIGLINGTIGVNFRYQLPFITFMIWAIVRLSSFFPLSLDGRNLNIVGEESEQ
jgi:hypothetical protein